MTDKIKAAISDQFEIKNWNANCRFFGLKPEDFGKTIVMQGMRLVICGLNARASKNVVKVIGTDGTRYTISASTAKNRLLK